MPLENVSRTLVAIRKANTGWPAKFKKQIPVFFLYISSIAADFPVYILYFHTIKQLEFFISYTMVGENFVFSYHLSPRIQMLRNDYIVFQYIFQYLGEKVYVFQYFSSSNLIPVEFQYFQYRWPPCNNLYFSC